MVDVDTLAVLRPSSAASPVPPGPGSVGCSSSPPACATRSVDNDLSIGRHVCIPSSDPATAGGLNCDLSPLAEATPSSPSSTVSADTNATLAPAVVKTEAPECTVANIAAAAGYTSSTSSTTCDTPPSPIAHLEDYCIPSSPSSSPMMEDYGMPSSPSSSPIMDEAGDWMNLDHVHHMQVDDLGLDARPSIETLGLGHLPDTTSCTREGPCGSGDMFISQLDEFLQADLADSAAFPFVDDFFPGQDFPPMSGWAEESGCDVGPPVTAPSEELLQAANISGEQESQENVAQLFAQWLKSNSQSISLADLRKVKLKMSTIENATRRLGGGKKGLLQFLKFVLLWVQNCHMRRMKLSGNMHIDSVLNTSSDGIAFHPSMASGTSKVATTGCAVREGPTMDPLCIRAGSGAQAVLIDRTGGVVKNHSYPNTNLSSSWGGFSLFNQPWSPRECSGATTSSNNSSPRGGDLFSVNMRGFSAEHGTWQQHQGNVTQQLQAGLQERANLTPTNCSLGGGYTASQGIAHSQSPSFTTTKFSSSLMHTSTPAATTRAARKSRMERQRWSVRRHQHHQHHHNSSNNSNHTTRAAWMPSGSIAVAAAQTNSWSSSYSSSLINDNGQRLAKPSLEFTQQQGRKTERNLKLLFQKELKQSDVGNLGRIVLPKKAAETSLPPLELRDGVNLVVEDLNSSKVWNMRYRFWPNNKSRMYLLENTGDFVKSYDLKEGDIMMLYRNITTNKYAIKGAKSERFGKPAASMDLGTVDQAKSEPGKGIFGYSGLTKAGVGNNPSCNIFPAASESTCDDDALLAELIEQSLENI